MTNYVVLRFGDLKPEPNASFFFCAIYVYNIVFYWMNYMSLMYNSFHLTLHDDDIKHLI